MGKASHRADALSTTVRASQGKLEYQSGQHTRRTGHGTVTASPYTSLLHKRPRLLGQVLPGLLVSKWR
jgi:hypothetical protein